MKKILIFIFLFSSMLFAQHNDSIINYIFENRFVFEEYFPDETAELRKQHDLGLSSYEN